MLGGALASSLKTSLNSNSLYWLVLVSPLQASTVTIVLKRQKPGLQVGVLLSFVVEWWFGVDCRQLRWK